MTPRPTTTSPTARTERESEPEPEPDGFTMSCPPILLCVLLVVGFALAAPITTAATAPSAQTNGSNTTAKNTPHTLIVKTTGDSVRYSVSASKGIDGETAERDSVQGTTLTGRVGGLPWKNTSNDTKDVIRYAGYIQTFQYNGSDVRLFLDGQRISPSLLTGNHVRISRPNKQPLRYQLTVTGRASTGESTEKNDRIQTTANGKTNGTTIRGRLSDGADSFYFKGDVSATSFSGAANTTLNGQTVSNLTKISNKKTKQPPAPTLTPTATAEPTLTPNTGKQKTQTRETKNGAGTETGTESNSNSNSNSTFTSTLTPSLSSTGTPANTSADSSNTGSSSSLTFLVSILGGLFVVGTLAYAVFWYLQPRQQRW